MNSCLVTSSSSSSSSSFLPPPPLHAPPAKGTVPANLSHNAHVPWSSSLRMSATLHSFDSHLSSIAFSPQGHTAFALSNVFGNDWTGHIAVTRAQGDVTNLPQQHGVTSAAWLGGDEAAVFGNEEGDLVCTAWASDGSGGQALQVIATATDFDAPVSGT